MFRSIAPSMRATSRILLVVCALGLTARCGHADSRVESTKHAPLGDGPFQAYLGTVSLPADGLWSIRQPDSGESIREIYLVPNEPARLRQLGQRMYAALEERHITSGQWQVQMGFEACRHFAQEHDGVGPKSKQALTKRWDYVATNWDKLHWRYRDLEGFFDNETIEGPFVHLIPEVRFEFSRPNFQTSQASGDAPARLTVAKEKRAVLAFELRPFVDDGKHWVLYTDGHCERIEIDSELVKSQQATIRPIMDRDKAKARAEQPHLDYKVILVASEPLTSALALTAENQILNQSVTIDWDVTQAADASKSELREAVDRARGFAWQPYLAAGGGGVLDIWSQSSPTGQQQNDPPRNLSMFSILGGRAAIEETLQLQNLAVADSGQAATIDLDSIEGVKVTSHPFEEMLDGSPGGQLELARCVPSDRFFVYVGKPESIPALLDTGAPFIASIGTTLTGNCLQYNLESRYLARLGMTRDWVDAVLTSGLTSEMAVFTPDLFFIDGTDVTVIAKLRQPQLLRQLLSLLGAGELSSKSILELPTQSGSPAFMALRDDLLLASTNRSELESSIELLQQEGHGSLGDSHEFRFMLTKLPVNEETRIYAYLSDPFVRRLVGPRVKIGQRRRVLEKAKMEALTSRALLARLDGHPDPESVDALALSNHIPASWNTDNFSIEPSGLVRSERYGSLPRMRSLPEVPIEKITKEEAEAYQRYVENYSRYWRRFFDPIAIRLDDVGTNQLELSTFILPLVDNSIYNGLRMALAHRDDKTTLSVPIVEPEPVVQFSVNLKEQAWQAIAGNFSEFFSRYSGASPAMLDDFGPSAHVAIFDADPIIAIGSGDVFGAFGGNLMQGDADEMLMVPVVLSMLTRPCSIMIETSSPKRTAQYLRQAALAGIPRQRRFPDFGVSFYQVEDRDEWVWTMDIMGVVKLRYGIEVSGKYLVIRNIPWSSEDRVVSTVPAELNAAVLEANPSACKLQLPGLFAAASDANRRAVMSGLGRLYPFMIGGASSVSDATNQHRRLFGFYPRQFDEDQWMWKDFRMVSEQYGRPNRQRQPAFDPQQPFGLMNRIDTIKLNMQFEEDGLRSSVQWRLR